MIKIPGYHGLCKQGHYNRRFHGGVAIYAHTSCPFEPITINSNIQVIAMRIQLHLSYFISVASIYIPGREQVTFEDINDIINQLPSPFLLLGDFNSHSPLWGNTSTDTKGKIIERILHNPLIACLNNGTATHESGTAIDLSLASSSLVPDVEWTVLPSVLCSDHHPILLKVATNQPEIPHSTRFCYSKGNWEEYTLDGSWNELIDESNFINAIELLEYFYKQLNSMKEKYIPQYIPKRFYPRTFWNQECKRMIHERERLYRKYKQTKAIEDKIHWKHQRAFTKRYIKECKKDELHNYLEKMNHTVPISQIYEKLRQMRGKPPRTISVLNINNAKVTTTSEIANALADSFASNSSYKNCTRQFLSKKRLEEANKINFPPTNTQDYNLPFKINELKSALSTTKNTSPGNDQIHYLMIKHLPENALLYLLCIYNRLWTELYYPPQWNLATVIPIPKPGKNHTDPTNYRPIALTSCFGKLFEKMINRRLVEYLENHKLLTPLQCGFRKYRSTIDHLIRLDTYIKKSFSENKVTVGVFFDLAKAYDTTWRYGILKDMKTLGLGGTLPRYIEKFLEGRRFRVFVGGELSSERIQEAGVPQGSILSVTLFAIKINSLATIIPRNIHTSLFVDDVQIALCGNSMHEVVTNIQPVINKMSKWAEENGFQFSPSKTNCMVFHRKPDFPIKPTLRLKGNALKVEKSVKFLGLNWDPQLQWKTHIDKLVTSCNSSMNLLRTLSSTKWGADHHILLQTYRLIIRPKIDYGCLVYGSAAEATLRKIDAIHNEALRICAGAFKSSPVESLYILANEPSLSDRRTDLQCRKYFKNKCFLLNPVYNSIMNTPLYRQFENTRPHLNPFIQRANKSVNDLEIPLQPVLPYKTPSIYSWCLLRPTIDTDLATPLIKDIANFFPFFRDHISSNYPTHIHLYTDGSKDNEGVGAAAIYNNKTLSASLPKIASVYTAELKALMFACTLIREDNRDQTTSQYLICSDSLSAVQGLQTMNPENHLMHRLQLVLHELLTTRHDITVLWIPGHKEIPGNDKADKAAKSATRKIPQFITCPYTDWFPEIKNKVKKKWEYRWQQTNNKLKSITDKPCTWKKLKLTRRDGVILNRLRIGHTKITHDYLMDDATRQLVPQCSFCNNDILTVEHIMLHCQAISDQRQTMITELEFQETTLSKILGDHDKIDTVLRYLRDIDIYSKI